MCAINKYLAIISCTLATLLMACDEYDIKGFFVPTGAPVNKRFEQSIEQNAQQHNDTIIKTNRNTYNIYIASDFHITNTANCMAQYLSAASKDSTAALALMLGDITDAKGGHAIAHDTIKASLSPHLQCRSVVGNHDLFFNQWESYKHYWGSSTYYFIIETPDTADLYICLDSGSGTLGNKQLNWLKNILLTRRANYRHCIVATHTNFWDTELGQFPSGTFSMEETAVLQGLFAKHDVNIVLNGHDHHHETHQFNGTKYITIGDAIDNNPTSGYVIMTIGNDIDFERKETNTQTLH